MEKDYDLLLCTSVPLYLSNKNLWAPFQAFGQIGDTF
jgi:hypothetical protein